MFKISSPATPSEAERALESERQLPLTGWQQEVSKGLEFGLEGAESIGDRSIPTFSRSNSASRYDQQGNVN